MAGVMAASAYVIASPTLTPSLIASIRENASRHGDNGWNVTALTAISATVLACTLANRILKRSQIASSTQFLVYFGIIVTAVPVIWFLFGRTFLPQPNRYKMEMDFAWAFIMGVAIPAVWKRMPQAVALALSLLLLSLGAEIVSKHRKYSKELFFPSDVSKTLDYRAARFIDAQLPVGGRIFASGSMAPWFNYFSNREQFSGGAFTTAFNQVHETALEYVFDGGGSASGDPQRAILWLQAFGVQAMVVPGKDSPETWHPFQDPRKFEGLLKPIWKESDTTIYEVPMQSLSLAHVVDDAAVVRHTPRSGSDTGEIGRYVADLQNSKFPIAPWKWKGSDAGSLDTRLAEGQTIALQISYHPGWHARVNGMETPLGKDGLGLMWLKPKTNGQIHVELTYDGGWEMRACRIASGLGMIALAAFPWWRRGV